MKKRMRYLVAVAVLLSIIVGVEWYIRVGFSHIEELWERVGTSKEPVRPVETVRERAIQIAKDSYVLEPEKRTEDVILERMQERGGYGWYGYEEPGEVVLVTYAFEVEGKDLYYPFEVDVERSFVRNVVGDKELEEKYGFGSNCRHDNPDDVNICLKCGSKLDVVTDVVYICINQ